MLCRTRPPARGCARKANQLTGRSALNALFSPMEHCTWESGELLLQVADMFDRLLDDLGLLDAAAALALVTGRHQVGQVHQAVVHPVPPPLLDDAVGRGILPGNENAALASVKGHRKGQEHKETLTSDEPKYRENR